MPRRRTLTSSCWSSRSTRTAPASPVAASWSTPRTPRPGGRTTTWRRPSRPPSCWRGPLARTGDAPPRRQLRLLTWGLVPSWSKDPGGAARMINARVESVADKPAFARAAGVAALPGAGARVVRVAGVTDRARRQGQAAQAAVLHLTGRRRQCRHGRPVRVLARPDGQRRRRPAGLADAPSPSSPGPPSRGSTASTTASRSSSSREEWATWLDPATGAADVLGLLEPRAAGRFTAYPVSRAVSSNRSNGPQLLDRAAGRGARRGRRPGDRRGHRGPRVSGPAPASRATGPVRCGSSTPRSARRGPRRPDPTASRPVSLVLGHGAGGLRWTLDVLATRDAAVTAGWVVVLVDQPWRVAGQKVGRAPASLDVAWLPVLAALAADLGPGPARRRWPQRRRPGRVPHGRGRGRSRGRGAVLPAAPARPGPRARAPRSSRCRRHDGIPVHVVQGRTDPFGTPAELEAVLPPDGDARRRHRGPLDRRVGARGGRPASSAAADRDLTAPPAGSGECGRRGGR